MHLHRAEETSIPGIELMTSINNAPLNHKIASNLFVNRQIITSTDSATIRVSLGHLSHFLSGLWPTKLETSANGHIFVWRPILRSVVVSTHSCIVLNWKEVHACFAKLFVVISCWKMSFEDEPNTNLGLLVRHFALLKRVLNERIHSTQLGVN